MSGLTETGPRNWKRPALGGQAVLEGVFLRSSQAGALALRLPNSTLLLKSLIWWELPGKRLKNIPLLRGFPLLLENLVNGLAALNLSVALQENSTKPKGRFWQALGTLGLTLLLVALLMIVLPHFLAWLENSQNPMTRLRFQLWDGLFKFLVLIAYVTLLGLLPSMRRMFQYHGAEHKVVNAFEAGELLSARSALRHSRLHPRCGTVFLSYVLLLSIALHSLLLPCLELTGRPQNIWQAHLLVLAAKLALLPLAAGLAYELIRLSPWLERSSLGKILLAPGLLLQFLTTRQPSPDQLEVALVALLHCLDESWTEQIQAPDYSILE